MEARLTALWSSARDSFWLIPGLSTLVALALATALTEADRQGLFWAERAPWWVYPGGAEGARSVLDAITGSLITVTGVIFSVTIVAVQLASSQYTPRVLRNFSSDRGNQVSLGIFIGTFTYGFLVLRTTYSAPGEGDAFVPRLAVTVAVCLLLVCVATLIYFIDHVAHGIRVTTIVDHITRETVANVHRLFPAELGDADPAPPPDPRHPEHPSVTVRARTSGYIQVVDEESLFDLGSRSRVVIGMVPRVGDFVLAGRPLAEVRAEGPVDEEMEEAIRSAFVLGRERTPDQDVEFGVVQISDIAIRALSPSMNDPTTAIRCIDRLAEILAEFARRHPPEPRRTREGGVHFIASHPTFERVAKVAFDDIRYFGAEIPLVAERLLEVLAELVTLVPAGRREPLLAQARAVLHTAREEIRNPRDRADLERVAERLAPWMDAGEG